MDVRYFLKERTKFIRFYYDEAVKPFLERKRMIDDHEPPFDNPPFSDDGEPPYLEEWMEAATAENIVGLASISLLSDTLKLYLNMLQTYVIRFKFDEEKPFRDGFPPAFKAALGEILATDWSDCPADWAIIEQIVLARNQGQHGGHLTSFSVTHAPKTLVKHPNPFFVREEEKRALQDGESLSFLGVNITVTRENLFAAIEQLEILADWIEGRMDKVRAWREAQARDN
jgi:hypothetical protein